MYVCVCAQSANLSRHCCITHDLQVEGLQKENRHLVCELGSSTTEALSLKSTVRHLEQQQLSTHARHATRTASEQEVCSCPA